MITVSMTLQARAKLAFVLPFLGSSHEDSQIFVDVVEALKITPEEMETLKAIPQEDSQGNPAGYRWFMGADEKTLVTKEVSLEKGDAKRLLKFVQEFDRYNQLDHAWRSKLIQDLKAAVV